VSPSAPFPTHNVTHIQELKCNFEKREHGPLHLVHYHSWAQKAVY